MRLMRESAQAAIAGGIEFLATRQGADGLWRDFHTPAGAASAWPTAYVGDALGAAGARHEVTDRAADALTRCQQADGGWGYNEETPSDADSTSWAVLFLAHHRQPDRIVRCAATCLARHQRQRSGGVATYAEPGPIRRYMGVGRWLPFTGWCRPQIEISAVAGRAFRALPQDPFRHRADAAWRFVRSRQNGNGSWNSYWWTSSHFATAQAADLARTVGDHGSLRRAALWARQRQHRDGGWRLPGEAGPSPFATALALSVLTADGTPGDPAIGRAIDALAGMQQVDGGWPSDARMRIPMPPDPHPADDHRRHLVRFGPTVVVRDQHRTFTTTTCVSALTGALRSTG